MKDIKLIRYKSQKVLMFEYASGRKLEDYLVDKNNKCWTLQSIANDMNETSWKKYPKRIINFTDDNISKYFRNIGIKTTAQRGRKAEK